MSQSPHGQYKGNCYFHGGYHGDLCPSCKAILADVARLTGPPKKKRIKQPRSV